MDKTILITGCSSGIGYSTAHVLREKGWRVFASCRQEVDCQRLKAEGFDAPLINYDEPKTIETGLQEVLTQTGGTIFAVFNNGAFASPGLIEDMPRGAFQEVFETNLFGVHDLTRAVIPVMRAQGYGRILQCSSVLGLVGAQMRGAYVATKHALEGYSDVLRLELAQDPIDVVLIEPGPIGTKIRTNSQKHFEKWVNWEASARRDFYETHVLKRLYDETGEKSRFELPPEAVAEKVYHALIAKRPKTRYYVTTPTYIAGWSRRLLPDRLRDHLLKKS